MNWKNGLWLALVLLLSGCASPQVRYYSLSGVDVAPNAVPAVPRSATYELALQVSSVPTAADRIQLVVVDPAQAPAVQVLNDSLWVAPLRDQLQSQLGAEVAQRLQVPRVIRSTAAVSGLPTRDIVVRVTRFDLVWGRAAWLEATWTDHAPGANRVKTCQASLSQPAGTSVSSLVQAQQDLIVQLAQLIAQSSADTPVGGRSAVSKGCTF